MKVVRYRLTWRCRWGVRSQQPFEVLMMRIIRLAVVSLACLLVPTTAAAARCTCSAGAPATAARNAAAVFVGRVVRVSPLPPDATDSYRQPRRLARLVVAQAIKGVAVGDTVTVRYVQDTGGNCGWDAPRGSRHLVYAWTPTDSSSGRRAVELWTGPCAGTEPIQCAATVLRALGARVPADARGCGRAPIRAPDQPPRSETRAPAAT